MLKSIGESKLVKPIIGLMLASMVLSFSISILGMPISDVANAKPATLVNKVLPKKDQSRKPEAIGANQATAGLTPRHTGSLAQHRIQSNSQVENSAAANANVWKAANHQPVPERSSQPKTGSKIDIYLLARVIYAESRGEPFQGQVAVGAVLLNRLEDSRFPKSLPQIIFKKGEFCTVRDGQIWKNPSQEAIKAARLAAAGWDPTGGALYFYNPAKTTSRWIWSRPVVNRIGNHIFAS